MKKIKITTPENIDIEYALAGLGSRSAAAFIDMLIQSIAIVLLIVAAVLIRNYSNWFWVKYYGWILGICLFISVLIIYAYFIIFELNTNGATFGKKILKIRTIRENGQPITLKHSAIRNLFKIFIDMLGVGVVLMFFSKKYKRLGDFAASTIVIADENKTMPITLEDLQNINENFSYYISKEEQEILREYFQRKNQLENYIELRQELRMHFTNKFESLGILKEWQDFISKI
ncbi:hypothetical protein CPAST_c27160 [Clostridium pasteurianum DSM 525 = ATCC 6013]|uniref:RDD domain containing protein n=1 Tax=Clostridium pasteurianum DSM 525 = ATCC 6013 TaxID=1262449 RepID=A0A0H3J9J6_CLOPA|nr:RDD family protein [Clostridium pasteurianum]AJA48783.1 hypothetical protein CPAST_c27160 [Clostridium pasteurianum DSM 525 = ATCC 6013]AJA52771.1 hypothetical protein CLPA_c27160 [Clostridium pasteurianum DSM 525 = ATCC 6013]AOZ76004.1 hypothetical protein AQ983_13200 [Clostridium pasteurianum DSM 525 = ATCC 6013]AOZ79800.1 hypothetical protein AQ984_13195 [Clostridium pasteurianum]ELP60081.1 hypothetical protein F502_05577 [Clostridium pasteurianum DSM 525 = ATCC 6013]